MQVCFCYLSEGKWVQSLFNFKSSFYCSVMHQLVARGNGNSTATSSVCPLRYAHTETWLLEYETLFCCRVYSSELLRAADAELASPSAGLDAAI
jgi:hypothetical protein